MLLNNKIYLKCRIATIGKFFAFNGKDIYDF